MVDQLEMAVGQSIEPQAQRDSLPLIVIP